MKTSHELLKHQLRADYATKNFSYTCMISGTGAGKTWFGRIWSLSQAIKGGWRDTHYAISPFIGMSKKTLVLPMLYQLHDWGMKEGEHFEFNKTDRALYFKHNKNIIYIGGAKSHESLQGEHVKSVLCDEAGQYANEAWLTIDQRRSMYDAPCLITTTPYRFNFVYDLNKEFEKNLREGKKSDIYAMSVPSIANPYYSAKGFWRAKETWPEWKFKMFYLGIFSRPMGVIYPNAYKNIVDPFPIPSTWEIFGGIDFGLVHPTAIVWIARDPQTDTYYVFDEVKKVGIDEQGIHDRIKDKRNKYYCDNASAQTILGLWNKGNHTIKCVKDFEGGVTLLNTMFNTGKLQIFSDCIEMIKELNTYSYQITKEDLILPKPVKENDDLSDALRYALCTHLGTPKTRVTAKGDRSRKKLREKFSAF